MTNSIARPASRWFLLAISACVIACARAQDTDELGRRAAEEIRWMQSHIQQLRGHMSEFVTSRTHEHDGFVKDDMAAFRAATEKEIACYEKAMAAWQRREELEARRWREEADRATRRKYIWQDRISDRRAKQHDAMPAERWYAGEARAARGESLAALNNFVRSRRAASEAWGKLAEATVPGVDMEQLNQLHDAAIVAESRREIAQWKFNWAVRRQNLFHNQPTNTPAIAAALADWDKVHAERLQIRESEIAQDQRVRELERAERKAERDAELAVEAARQPDPNKRWKRPPETGTPDETIKPASPLVGVKSSLSDGWHDADIGAVRFPGGAVAASNTFTIRASGWGAWGPDDAFHFVWREIDGDGQIIARLAEVDEAHGKLTASAMVRESIAGDAAFAGATIHPSGQVRLSCRFPTNAPPFIAPENVVTKPKWMRLTRRGDVFTAYSSVDGKFWQEIESRTIEMKSRALFGVAAWTEANVSCGELKLDSVQVVPGTPGHTLFANADEFAQGVICRDGVKVPGANPPGRQRRRHDHARRQG